MSEETIIPLPLRDEEPTIVQEEETKEVYEEPTDEFEESFDEAEEVDEEIDDEEEEFKENPLRAIFDRQGEILELLNDKEEIDDYND